MTSCEHCEAVRARQAEIAWGGQPLTPAMNFPHQYWSAGPPPPTRSRPKPIYDRDPGSCPCRCHEVWRLFTGNQI